MAWKEICTQRVVIGELELEVSSLDVDCRELPADVAEILFTEKKSSVSGLVREMEAERDVAVRDP
jgi:hypothetical protein